VPVDAETGRVLRGSERELAPNMIIPGIDSERITLPEDRYSLIVERKLPLPTDNQVKSIWAALLEDLRENGTPPGWTLPIRSYVQKQWKRNKFLGHLAIWHYVEMRCRLSGGMFFFARHILRLRKLLRQVHGYQLCDYLERTLNQNLRYHFRWHRGSFKSTVVAYAAPIWVMGIDPRQSILLMQAGDKDIQKSLRRIRRTIETRAIVYATFPHLLPAKSPITKQNIAWGDDGLITIGKDMVNEHAIEGDYSLYGVSTMGSATGWHPSLAIGDDLHTIQNTKSALLVQRVKDFWEDCTGPAISTGSPVWLIDTPWTVDDLGSEIDAGRYGKYHCSIMPVKREIDGHTYYSIPTGDIKRQLERADELHLYRQDIGFDERIEEEKKEACGSYFRWMAQYMCEPVPPGEVHFAEDGWKTWTDEDGKAPWNHPSQPRIENVSEARAKWIETLYIFGAWDPAVAQQRQSDYTACVIFGLSSSGIIYILDYVYDKIPPRMNTEMIHQLFLPPSANMPRFWRDKWVWPTPESPVQAAIERCWRPDFIVTDKSVVEQSFRSGIDERQDRTGYVYPIWGTYTEKGRGKPDWILKCLDRYFADGRIRVRSPLVKPMYSEGGRTFDLSRKVQIEYNWFMRESTHDDFLDCLAKGSYYWGGAFRPKKKQEERRRTPAERMLEGFLRPATEKEVVPGLVEVGSPVPAGLNSSPMDRVLKDMIEWTRHYTRGLSVN